MVNVAASTNGPAIAMSGAIEATRLSLMYRMGLVVVLVYFGVLGRLAAIALRAEARLDSAAAPAQTT